MKKQEDILEKIHEVGRGFLSKKTMDEAYKIVVKEALSHYEGFEGSVLIAEGGELKRIYASSPLFYNIKVKKNDTKFRAYRTLRPLLISGKEYKTDEKNYPFLKSLKIRSIILVPLSYAHKRVGVFVIWSKKAKPKMSESPKLIKLLGFIAYLSMQKLEPKIESPENSEKILSRIYESTINFLAPLTTEETYSAVVKEAVRLVNADGGILRLEDKGLLKSVYTTYPDTTIEPRNKGWAYTAYSQHKAFVVHSNELEKVHPLVTGTGVRSVVFIPLSYRKKSFGVLVIRSLKNREFKGNELNVLKVFGSLASLTIRKAQLYDEAKQAADTRDLFISLAAHELRTPLTTLNGYIQLLLTKLRGKKKIRTSWIYDIAFEANRLKILVEEFLEINRVRTGKLQFVWRESNLREIIKRAISSFIFIKPDRKIVFENKLNGSKDLIIGDSEKLIQVITNVLENADKYSDPDREIVIKLSYKAPDYVLKVVDQGQGIEEKDLPLIFKGFYKGRNSQHEGMGLGLFLAKKIIEAHHGSISIESQISKGTSILIKLPKAQI